MRPSAYIDLVRVVLVPTPVHLFRKRGAPLLLTLVKQAPEISALTEAVCCSTQPLVLGFSKGAELIR